MEVRSTLAYYPGLFQRAHLPSLNNFRMSSVYLGWLIVGIRNSGCLSHLMTDNSISSSNIAEISDFGEVIRVMIIVVSSKEDNKPKGRAKRKVGHQLEIEYTTIKTVVHLQSISC
jgi:hypothetical protein